MLGGGLLNKYNSLKLQKFKEKNSKRQVIVTAIIISILLLSGIYLYSSFAVFTEEKNFNVINGEVTDPGDIYFAYYVDSKITREFPKQNAGYTLDIEKSNCTNGVTITWDDSRWSVTLNYQGYKADYYTRTKCNLYFEAKSITAIDTITALVSSGGNDLITDEYGNIRYIGANPNNYVSIDGELWRIIGVMKDIDNGNGIKEDRIKLIRNETIGIYSFQTSTSNDGWGINEWSNSNLMKLLNPGYENESVGGSLYWNNSSGTCYQGSNFGTDTCDFTNIGIKDNLKKLIDNALWNTGSTGSVVSWTTITTSNFYELERSKNTGKICMGGNLCNDDIERTTAWVGKVGLIYPSDYDYATSGSTGNYNRKYCLQQSLNTWNNYQDCYQNSWIYYENKWQWTLTPLAYSDSAVNMLAICSSGNICNGSASYAWDVIPTVYLKSNVQILSGEGSITNPFVLG